MLAWTEWLFAFTLLEGYRATMPIRSKLNRRPLPRIIPWTRASERLNSPDPALARVLSRAASPDIQKSLALRIEMKKSQYFPPLR